MKKTITLLLLSVLFAGCACMNSTDTGPQTNTPSTPSNPSDNTNPPSNTTQRGTLEDLMSYFKNEGITFDRMDEIENIDFGAHEGKLLEYNGETLYLYRLNPDRYENQNWYNDIKTNGLVTVNLDGEDKQFYASVNGDYLLVYDMNTDMTDIETLFNDFNLMNNSNSTSDSENDALDQNGMNR